MASLVSRRLLNAGEVAAWARGEGFANLVPAAWHVTVVQGLPSGIGLDPYGLIIPPSPRRAVRRLGGFTVITFTSLPLARRHRLLRAAGCSWVYSRYLPHVTFTADDRRDLGEVSPYTGALRLGPEAAD